MSKFQFKIQSKLAPKLIKSFFMELKIYLFKHVNKMAPDLSSHLCHQSKSLTNDETISEYIFGYKLTNL